MLSFRCKESLHTLLRTPLATFTTSVILKSHQPNAPLDLDPSFKALLQDVDFRKNSRHRTGKPSREDTRELEVFPHDQAEIDSLEEEGTHTTRKSPAAHFGSQQIGAVVLPEEMQHSINSIIDAADKTLLHSDATRLFNDYNGPFDWDTSYDVKYKSRKQASRHAERDGTAFASVALPAHYSAIYSVLNHARHRLGTAWGVKTLYDWGAGTGSALWAASHVFQNDVEKWQNYATISGRHLRDSTLGTYTAIEKREGFTAIGKRLLTDVDHGGLHVSWKRSLKEEDKLHRHEGRDAVAISAFLLSSLPTPLQRKALVKEMWESGAGTIILIDHNSRAGFGSIIEARDSLLNMGKREMEGSDTSGIKGSHVVAPCPHDGACPLDSTRLVCGFSQRMQRPGFIRKTKHSGTGHEDIGYSYVIIQRGARQANHEHKIGRVGEVGRREKAKQITKNITTELQLHDQSQPPEAADITSSTAGAASSLDDLRYELSDEMLETLRQEAFHWPRLVFAPLKRSGHIILDVCAPGGNIMRMTIPKSQGKQPYYDARKSHWGDIFPHEPKNPPQVRYQPVSTKRQGSKSPTKGANIGKWGTKSDTAPSTSYNRLADEIKSRKRELRKLRRESVQS